MCSLPVIYLGPSVFLQCGRPGFDPCIGKIPWRRRRQPTPVFLPGESHGQRSLAGYNPRGCKRRTQLSDYTTNHHPVNRRQGETEKRGRPSQIGIVSFNKLGSLFRRLVLGSCKTSICLYQHYKY